MWKQSLGTKKTMEEEKTYLEKHVRNNNGAAERKKNVYNRKKEKWETRRLRKE